jgi:hypothetical protein
MNVWDACEPPDLKADNIVRDVQRVQSALITEGKRISGPNQRGVAKLLSGFPQLFLKAFALSVTRSENVWALLVSGELFTNLCVIEAQICTL